MRIVLTTNFSPWSSYSGGGQRSTHQLATALHDAGHDVHVVYTAPPFREPVPSDPPVYQIHWATFFDPRGNRAAPLRPLNAVSVLGVIRRIQREKSIDVVHCQGEEGALLGPWVKARGIGLVLTPRYPTYPEVLQPRMPATSRAWMWIRHGKYMALGIAIRGAARICPTSEAAAQNIRRAYGVSPARMTVVPNGIQPVMMGGEWQGNREGELLFYGRLAHDKGVDVLLEAVASTDYGLHIVGRGESETALRAQANSLGLMDRIRWTPWMEPEALRGTMEQAAMVVLPSRAESFGNAMAEALAVGVPLVTTHAGSIPGVVGEGALCVPPGDSIALARAIASVEQEPEQTARRREIGLRRMADRYQWSAVAASFVQVYEEVRNELGSRSPLNSRSTSNKMARGKNREEP